MVVENGAKKTGKTTTRGMNERGLRISEKQQLLNDSDRNPTVTGVKKKSRGGG